MKKLLNRGAKVCTHAVDVALLGSESASVGRLVTKVPEAGECFLCDSAKGPGRLRHRLVDHLGKHHVLVMLVLDIGGNPTLFKGFDTYDMPLMMTCAAILAGTGVVLNQGILIFEKRMATWRDTSLQE